MSSDLSPHLNPGVIFSLPSHSFDSSEGLRGELWFIRPSGLVYLKAGAVLTASGLILVCKHRLCMCCRATFYTWHNFHWLFPWLGRSKRERINRNVCKKKSGKHKEYVKGSQSVCCASWDPCHTRNFLLCAFL